MRSEIRERIEKIKKGEVPEGYKKVNRRILPCEWEIIPLKNIITELKSGVSVNSEDKTCEKGEYGILKTSCVSKGKFLSSENKKIIDSDLKRAKLNPKKGLIIISRMNTPDLVGEIGYVDKDYDNLFIPDRLWQTVFSVEVVSRWLAYLLTTYRLRNTIKNIATGTSNSMKNISKDKFLNIEIDYPPYIEQRKIADILSTWDKAIELKEKLIDQKKEQKRGLMKKLLTGKIRLSEFNTRWQRVQLGDVFERVTRKNTVNNTNVLTISAQRGLINQEDFFSKSIASSILDNYYLLKKGEFAYNKSYSNGYPMGAIKRLNMYESGVVTTLYICFKIKNDSNTNSDFFEQYFESGLLNYKLTKIAQEGGRAHGLLNVSPSDFFKITITIPGKGEQEAIAKILCTADKEINLHQQELEALKLQKKGLMQLLLTGIVRVNN